MRSTKLALIITLGSFFLGLLKAEENNRFCKDGDMNAPIDISPPLENKDFSVAMTILDVQVVRITKLSDHEYKLTGDFGLIEYDKKAFVFGNVYIKSPSEHKVNGERLPMEMQFVLFNDKGEQLNIIVLFELTDQKNVVLDSLDFGYGELIKLPEIWPGDKEQFHEIKRKINISPLFSNENHWLMYEGSDTNIPCGKTTYLISYQPMIMSEKQLSDFNPAAKSDFTMKSLGSRKLYQNKPLKEKELEELQKKRDEENAKIKKAADLQREAELQALREQARQEQEKEKLNAKNKEQSLPTEDPNGIPQRSVNSAFVNLDDPFLTEDMLERLMKSINLFNERFPKKCPNYAIYSVPEGESLGWVPEGAKMTWEVDDITKNGTIAEIDELPESLQKDLSFKPFFYIKRPKCIDGHLEFPPSKKALLMLAEEGELESDKPSGGSSSEKTKEKPPNEYVPVLVRCPNDYNPPKSPTPTFNMWDPIKKEPHPVNIQRKFLEPNKDAQKKLDDDQDKAKQNPKSDGGYKIKGKENSGKPDLQKPPKKFRRVWPVLKAEEGYIPKDALTAWDPISESSTVINLIPPASPSANFRWILFFYANAQYKINKEVIPLLPVYILAHKKFKWTKGLMPQFIPVPLNNVPFKGSLQVEDLEIKFAEKSSKELFRDENLLKPPQGVDPAKTFKKSLDFRLSVISSLNNTNADYKNHTMDYYSTLTGEKKILDRERDETMTGILVKKDKVERHKNKRPSLSTASDKLKMPKITEPLKLSDERKEQLLKSHGLPPKEILKMRRVCTKRSLVVVLNVRTEGQHRRFTSVCKKYEWKPIYTTEQKKERAEYLQMIREEENTRRNCLNHLNLVLNTRGKSSISPEMSKKCKDFYNEIRKGGEAEALFNSMTPYLDQIGSALKLKTMLMSLNPNLIPTRSLFSSSNEKPAVAAAPRSARDENSNLYVAPSLPQN